MYDQVYDAMVSAKIAVKMLTHPQYGLLVDETGGNTSMKNDGHGTNKKFLTAPGAVPKIRSSESDNHFTTMCFTALTGDPVHLRTLCVATGSRPDLAVESGFDEFAFKEATYNEAQIELSQNCGSGKCFPGGRTH